MEESKEMTDPKEKKEDAGESPTKKQKVQVEADDSAAST
jgi:hypothetical protein